MTTAMGLALLLGPGIAQAEGVTIDVPAHYGYGVPKAAEPALRPPSQPTALRPRGAVDPGDPLIVAKALALGNDAGAIFAWVRDEVGIDPYVGSLRGAHATLTGKAGNALDRASLAIALLRAAGNEARYVQGTLSYDDAQRILARAFADPQRMVGCNNPQPWANGRLDFWLIAAASNHTWLEYRSGSTGAWTRLDPAFAEAVAGQEFATATATFDELPASQQHRLRVRVIAETYSQAGAMYGFALSSTTVLDQSFDVVDLVDRPLTLGHFVTRAAVPSPTVSAITNRYTPYLLRGDSTLDPADYAVSVGTETTELLTSYPLGTTLLTGLFVQLDVIAPNDPGNPQVTQRVLYDLIGYATRQTGGQVATSGTGAPAVSPLDLLTIQASPAWQSLDAFAARGTRLAGLQAQLAAIMPQVLALPEPAQQTPDQVALRSRANDLNRYTGIAVLELLTASFEGAASRNAQDYAATWLVKPWIASPRLTLAHTRVSGDQLGFGLDLRKNDLSVYPLQGISWSNPAAFERARGIAESVLEGEVLHEVTGVPARSFASLFNATTPTELVPISRYDIGRVDTLQLSADARERIRDTLSANNGRSILAPRSPAMVGGTPYTVWLESDPSTGFTISTGEDGSHQSIGEYGGLLLALLGVDSYETIMARFIGTVNSVGVVGIAYTAAVLEAAASGDEFGSIRARIKQILNDATGPLAQAQKTLEDSGASAYCQGGCSLVDSMVSGLLDGINAFRAAINAGDPPVPSILLAPPLPELPAPVAPGASAGLTLDVVRDERYYVPYFGAELPTVYLAKITNTGPATDTFRIENVNANWGGFGSFVPAVQQVTLAAGASGEVGICIRPQAVLPAPDTPRDLAFRVYSPANPTASQTHSETIAVPSSRALSLRLLPDSATMQAGNGTSVTLTVDSLGNVPTTATLAAELPPGLELSGLPASVSLDAGQSRSYPLQMSVAAGTTSGRALVARIRGDFAAVDDAVAVFTANVSSPLTRCVSQAAIDADGAGRQGMAATLVRLAGAMDALAGAPDDPVFRTQVLVALQDLAATQFNGWIFSGFAAPLAATATTLASADASQVPDLLAAINTQLCGLQAVLAEAAAADFPIWLDPPVAVNLPTQAIGVNVNIRNATAVPRAFDVALGPLPAGVTAVLNSASVSIPAGETTNRCPGCAPPLTIAFSSSDGQARTFDYTVTVTPRDNPALAKPVVGSFVLRSDLIRIASIAASPRAVDAGTPVTVSIRVMNAINASRRVHAVWRLYDTAGNYHGGDQTGAIVLAPGDGVVDAPPFPINTAGLAGGYRVDAYLYDENACCDPIPNSNASTTFLVGQPLGAELSVSPSVVAPGTSTLDYTLTLSRESAPQPVIDLRSALPMPASTRSFARRGQYLYVCQRDRVQVVDTQDPDALAVVATFATDLLGTGYGIVGCNLDGDTLVLAWNFANESSFDDIRVVAFDLAGAHATAPQQLNAVPVLLPKRFGGRIAFNASHQGSLTTAAVLFNPFSNFIFAQYGNLIRLDFSTPSAPVAAGELFHHFDDGDTNDPAYGGPSVIGGMLARADTTLLATTSATGDGFGTGPGVGRVLAIDTTQLPGNCPGAANPCVANTLDIAAARVLGDIAAQGDIAIAVGDTEGNYDGRSGSTGLVTLSALDISNPAQPVEASTLVTSMRNRSSGSAPCASQPFSTGGSSLQALSDNYYAYGVFNPLSCAWALALIDANDPQHLRIIPYDVPSVLRQTILADGTLYALTDTTILVYDYATIAGPAITAHVDIPKGSGVTVAPASFSTPPTGVDTSASDHDTYTFYRPAAQAITWQGSVSGMTPGAIRTVATGGHVDYTVPMLGSGSLQLDAVNVTSDQAMTITPARQQTNPGFPLTYTITLRNPTATALAYTLGIAGVRSDWVRHFDDHVDVPAHGEATALLTLQATLGDTEWLDTPFVVTGAASSGFTTSAQAVFATSARSPGGDSTSPVYASALTLLDNPLRIGRGSSAMARLRVRNLGTGIQPCNLSWGSSEPGLSVEFLRSGFWVPPGGSTDVVARFSVSATAAAGVVPVQIYVNSYGPQIVATQNLQVLAQGVRLSVSPPSGSAVTSFAATVTNTGNVADTFDLSALGALGPAIRLEPAVVDLAPGASQVIAITLGDTGWLPPGTSGFDVQAVSRGDDAARARASATVTIAPLRRVNLYGVPPTIVAPDLPATRSFGVQLNNAGNADDAFELAIVGTSGAIQAALRDRAGAPVTSMAPLRLPGGATTQFTLDATLTGGESGSVTVRAVSQNDAAVSATTVLTLQRSGSPNLILGTPGALEFGDQIVTTTSPPRSIVLTNSGNAAFVIGNIATGGAQAAEFANAPGSNACVVGTSLAAGGGTCTLYATFTPAALGSRAATLTVNGTDASAVSVNLHGNGIAAPDRLGISITPLRNYAQYGRVVNYLVTVRNPAAIAISGATITSVLPPELDTAASSWICINAGDAGVNCAATGTGPLADSNVLVPALGSISYLLSAPVRVVTASEQATTSASVATPGFATPNSASATVQLVIFRDGFEAYGGGTGNVIDGDPFAAGDVLHFVATATALADGNLADLLVLRAGDGGEIRVEAIRHGDHLLLRLLVRDGDATATGPGIERTSPWLAVADGTPANLGFVEGIPRLILIDAAGQARRLEIAACCNRYRVTGSAVPIEIPRR